MCGGSAELASMEGTADCGAPRQPGGAHPRCPSNAVTGRRGRGQAVGEGAVFLPIGQKGVAIIAGPLHTHICVPAAHGTRWNIHSGGVGVLASIGDLSLVWVVCRADHGTWRSGGPRLAALLRCFSYCTGTTAGLGGARHSRPTEIRVASLAMVRGGTALRLVAGGGAPG